MRSFSRHLLFIAVLLSCSSPNETKEDFLRIRISKAMERASFNASEVVSDIEYVALETNDQCIIGEHVRLSISENYIIAFSYPSICLLFSRKGKFIRSIGQRGQGPVDFREDGYDVKIDEKTGRIYLIGVFEICVYRITGEYVQRLNLSELQKRAGISSIIWNKAHWKEDLFCGNIALYSGKEQYRFIIFNLYGEIVKLYNNSVFFQPSMRSTINYEACVYCFDDKLFFKEILCDTLFRVTEQYDLVPEIVFDLPGPKILNEKRGQGTDTQNYCIIRRIYEVENYLFLYCLNGEYFLYDKKNKQVLPCFPDPLLYEEVIMRPPNEPVMSRNRPIGGLRNDIDGGLPVWPAFRSHIQNNLQFITVYQSFLLKEKLTDEHFARQKFQNPEAHKRLKNLLSDLNEFDNPVIMISTFK